MQLLSPAYSFFKINFSKNIFPEHYHQSVKRFLESIILFATQLSMEFIMFINAKMPTIVGILTFINMINTTSECLKARKINILEHFC